MQLSRLISGAGHAAGAALLAMAVLSATPVHAGPFEDGVAAYQRQDYATALALFKPLAERGNIEAQYSMGVMYMRGRGVTQDHAQAAHWHRLAVVQGDSTAQTDLGALHANGQGVSKDEDEATLGETR